MSKKPNFFQFPLRLIRFLIIIAVLLFFFTIQVHQIEGSAPNLFINEIMVSNAEYQRDPEFNNYSDWIEVYNAGSSAVNLNGYFLTDDLNDPFQWEVGQDYIVDPGEYFIFWLDNQDDLNHTNFKLKHLGDDVGLFMADGTLIDGVIFDEQVTDVSYGRSPDGGSTWLFFQEPTPGGPNNTVGLQTNDQAEEPQFSAQGGFYDNSFNLTISKPSVYATVRYTLDGKPPKSNSPVANGPIAISDTSIVRARAFEPGKLDSPVTTHTYFIDDGSNLPIFSIVTDHDHFFDATNGIYVKGTNGIDIGCWGGAGNYLQDWERPISIELYEPDGTLGFKLNSGVEIHGYCGRAADIKSLDIKLDTRYGTSELDYELFPGYWLTEFKAFLLRPSSHDQYETMFRDGFVQTLIDGQMDIDKQAYRPAVLFINGQYWGIHNIREKQNDDYVESHHGEDDIDLINNRYEIKNGDLAAYDQLENFIINNDLSDPDNYETVASQIDIDEYINYLIAEMYSANTDWPHNNNRIWRPRSPDGKWRWMFFDLDKSWNNPERRMMHHARVPKDEEREWAIILFSNIIENETFRDEWLQRMAGHMNTTYETNRVLGIMDDILALIEPEIERHSQRWVFLELDLWEDEVQEMRTFAMERKAENTQQLVQFFNTGGLQNLTVNSGQGGRVAVSGMVVPDPIYSGPHFKRIPIRLEAIPDPGYQFVGWTELGISDVETFITLSADFTVSAVFEAADPPPNIVINELHYNPSGSAQGTDDDYEFLELVNISGGTVDLEGFTFSAGVDFTFPAGASMADNEIIVVAKNAATYSGLGCQVFQWVDTSLANGGETVQFEDPFTVLIDTVTYDDGGDWPGDPDGSGPSLELADPNLDNALSENWHPSVAIGGTPCAENSDGSMVGLVINEIHYNPSGAQGDDVDYEFLELVNMGNQTMDLEGFAFTVGIDFTFPVISIDPGEMLLLAKNAATYGGLSCPVLQWTDGSLSNGGENLLLVDGDEIVVDGVDYDDEGDWPLEPDSFGPSLELIDVVLDNALAANWQPSTDVGGTPCLANSDGNPTFDQEITLAAGWNMISANVQPADPDIETLLAGIDSNLVLIKSGDGEVYWPGFGNQIGDWDVRDGYQIFMSEGDTLTLHGSLVNPATTPVPLLSGWNLIGYLPQEAQAVDEALADLSGTLVLMKNGIGELYWPEYGVDQIGDMQPGEGYQLYVSAAGELTYP